MLKTITKMDREYILCSNCEEEYNIFELDHCPKCGYSEDNDYDEEDIEEEIEYELNNNINMKNLQQLTEPKTTIFDKFIIPVSKYIDEHYKIEKDYLNSSNIYNEILNEIRKENGIICFINANNHLIIENVEVLRHYVLQDTSILNISSFKLKVVESEDKKRLMLNSPWYCDYQGKSDNIVDDIYYIKDINALIDFINDLNKKKIEEHRNEALKIQKEYEDNFKLAEKFGLLNEHDPYNTKRLNKLVLLEKLQLEGLNSISTKELYKLLGLR